MRVDAYVLHCDSPDGDELLRETLETLHQSDYPDLSVCVIQNGSSAEVADRSIYLPKNLGVSVGYNFGLGDYPARLRPRYILLLNNDIIVDGRMVSELVSVAESDPKIGLVSPKIYYAHSNLLWYAGGSINFWTGVTKHLGLREVDDGRYDRDCDTGYANGCAMLVRSALVDDIGLMDTRFSPAYAEDSDYSLSAREAGWRVMFAPKAVLYHKVSQSIDILKD